MGRNRESLIRQIENALLKKMATGYSRHIDKKAGLTINKIYAWESFSTHMKRCAVYAKWVKQKYGCRYLEEIRPYVPEYLRMRIAKGLSAHTIKADAMGLAKLFSCSCCDWGVELPIRERANIKRSRFPTKSDRQFSITKNKDVIDFCIATGVRHHELVALRYYNISPIGTWIYVWRGKGGKSRVIPVFPEYIDHVINMRTRAINKFEGRVFLTREIKSRMDVHSYRREYAQNLYKYYTQTGQYVNGKPYHCRKDLAGVTYDRGVMRAVSNALGHERINVIAKSYLSNPNDPKQISTPGHNQLG